MCGHLWVPLFPRWKSKTEFKKGRKRLLPAITSDVFSDRSAAERQV